MKPTVIRPRSTWHSPNESETYYIKVNRISRLEMDMKVWAISVALGHEIDRASRQGRRLFHLGEQV